MKVAATCAGEAPSTCSRRHAQSGEAWTRDSWILKYRLILCRMLWHVFVPSCTCLIGNFKDRIEVSQEVSTSIYCQCYRFISVCPGTLLTSLSPHETATLRYFTIGLCFAWQPPGGSRWVRWVDWWTPLRYGRTSNVPAIYVYTHSPL